jgi:hypothetical protein
MLKVHKETLSSRAILFATGSLLFYLGVWVDSKLKPFARRQQAYFKNSQKLKQQLDATVVPEKSYLFTSDAVSMYTNIPTDRALQLICDHIRTTAHLVPCNPVDALCSAVRIVMLCNIFTFGDNFWQQISGTAMGCPPAPPCANTFYALCEAICLPHFQDNVTLYQRFIDDVLGLWLIIDPSTNYTTWTAFCAAINNMNFELEWIVSPLNQSVDYMDLSLSIQNTSIITALYEKPSNNHLYTPPHSCHPPGLLGGMVFGIVNRLYT